MVERNKSFQIAANVIMILLSVMCIVPFILLIMSSITKENILLKYGYSFWPREISFDAYKTLLVVIDKDLRQMPYQCYSAPSIHDIRKYRWC